MLVLVLVFGMILMALVSCDINDLVEKAVTCSVCGGTGDCQNCNGTGKTALIFNCSVCKGTGECQNCNGTGFSSK